MYNVQFSCTILSIKLKCRVCKDGIDALHFFCREVQIVDGGEVVLKLCH